MTAAATSPQPNQGAVAQSERHAATMCYSLDGDLRFISHHDELRMLVRALTRARWPLAYSQGFNPKPRVVIPLPRSVGMASECVRATVQLKEPAATTELFDQLAGAEGEVEGDDVHPGNHQLAHPHVSQVHYLVEQGVFSLVDQALGLANVDQLL